MSRLLDFLEEDADLNVAEDEDDDIFESISDSEPPDMEGEEEEPEENSNNGIEEEGEIEVSETPVQTMDGVIIPLKNVNEPIEIVDFGQRYRFVPIIDPGNRISRYFNVFHQDLEDRTNEDGSEKWNTLDRNLSRQYHISKTEEFVNRFTSQVRIVPDTAMVRTEPFYSEFYAETQSDHFKILKDDELTSLFKMFSNISEGEVKTLNEKTRLAITVSSSHDGKRKMTIRHVLSTEISKKGASNSYDLLNNFALLRHSSIVKHVSTISSFVDVLKDVGSQVSEEIERLRGVNSNEKMERYVTGVLSKLTKENRASVQTFWEMSPPEIRNLFHLTSIVSIAISRKFNFSSYINSITYLQKCIKKELHR